MYNQLCLQYHAKSALKEVGLPSDEDSFDVLRICDRNCYVDYHNPDYGWYSFNIDQKSRIAFGVSLLVHEERQGIGKLLVGFSEDLCRRVGVNVFMINDNGSISAGSSDFWTTPAINYQVADAAFVASMKKLFPSMKFREPRYKIIGDFL